MKLSKMENHLKGKGLAVRAYVMSPGHLPLPNANEEHPIDPYQSSSRISRCFVLEEISVDRDRALEAEQHLKMESRVRYPKSREC